MTWSYSDPGDNSKDAVRFLVGDTVQDDGLIEDEEINYILDEFDDVYEAAASVAEAIASRFAREVAHSGDGLSYSGNQLNQHYSDMAVRLRRLASRRRRSGAGPYVGGISYREREKADQEYDLIPSAFRSSMHDHPEAGNQRGAGDYQDPLRGES